MQKSPAKMWSMAAKRHSSLPDTKDLLSSNTPRTFSSKYLGIQQSINTHIYAREWNIATVYYLVLKYLLMVKT